MMATYVPQDSSGVVLSNTSTIGITGTVSTSGLIGVTGSVSISGPVSGVMSISGVVSGVQSISGVVTVTGCVSAVQGNAWTATVAQSGAWTATVAQGNAWTATVAQGSAWTATVVNAVSGVVSVSGAVSGQVGVSGAVSGVMSISGTVAATQSGAWTASVNNALSGVVSVSGTVTTSDGSVATSTSAVPAKCQLVGGSDGTNLSPFVSITPTTLGQSTTVGLRGVQAVSLYSTWYRVHRAGSSTKATITKTAVTGAHNVVTGFSYGTAVGSAAAAHGYVDLIDGGTGGATKMWTSAIPLGGGNIIGSQYFGNTVSGLWQGASSGAVTIEFSGAGPASSMQAVAMWGYMV